MRKSTVIHKIKNYLSGSLEGAIEFGTECVKIVKYNSGCTLIEKMERIILSHDIYVQGEVLQMDEFIEVLAPVVKSMGLTLRDVALVLPDNIFIISSLEIFKTETEDEKIELIRSELEEKIYNFDSTLYDIRFLNQGEIDEKKEEVLAIALSIEVKESYIMLLERAKLFPVLVTPTLYPLTLALLQQKEAFGIPLYKSGVLMNLGGGNTKILIESGRECKYYRTVNIGSNEGNKLIQEHLMVDSEVSEVVKRELDLMVDLPATNPYYALFSDFKHLIQDNFEQLERVLKIYEKNNSRLFIEWIVITGGVSNQKGIMEFLSKILHKYSETSFKIVKADYSSKFSSKLINQDEFILFDSLVGFLKD